MSARVATLLPAVAALVLALSAAPAAAATCRPGHGQRTIARSARAVLLGRTQPEWGYRLWGCSRRTGARHLLATGGEDRVLEAPMLRGTHVGYVDAGISGDDATIVSDDALHSNRRVAVRTVVDDGIGLRMGDDGALAWRETTTVPGQRLWLWRRGDTTRLADEGFELTGMRFTGRTLRWLHDGADRTAPPPPASVCPGHAGAGSTTTVDIISTATATVACWRATGASAAFAAAPRAVATAGSWVAVESANIIAVRDLLDPAAATRGVDAGSVYSLVVDEHGSLAWTFSTYTGGGHPPEYLTHTAAVWVDDAAGTHALGTTSIYDTVTLARDGSALRWSGEDTLGATTLVPRPAPEAD
jgi:hypothetical protein